MSIETAIQALFIGHGWTLCTAESCTGGAIAARLTKIAGASQYYMGSLIAYSNAVKEKILNVDKNTIAKGAVSKETVESMALGAIKMFDTDFAIAVSGIAGPAGGNAINPVGTVWIAIAKKDGNVFPHKIQCVGRRESVIEQSVEASLEFLFQHASG